MRTKYFQPAKLKQVPHLTGEGYRALPSNRGMPPCTQVLQLHNALQEAHIA
jgi:hypothetical protein